LVESAVRDFLELLGLERPDLLPRAKLVGFTKRRTAAYYVYSIWRTDRGAPVPFYVGKGCRDRIVSHRRPSAAHEGPLKARIFAKLERAGIEPLFAILARDLSEADAHAFEMQIIRLLGRINLRTGPLANLTDGGEGMSGHLGLRGRNNPSACAVVAEGRQFGSMCEADLALGLTPGRTRDRIEKGWPGYRRVGEEPKPNRKDTRGIVPRLYRAVVANGIGYHSLRAAARALGVHPPAVLRRIKFGWAGYYYEDEGQRPRSREAYGSQEHWARNAAARVGQCRAVLVDGETFVGINAAARSLGLNEATLRYRCRSENFPAYQLG
jgi:hypothetical protein